MRQALRCGVTGLDELLRAIAFGTALFVASAGVASAPLSAQVARLDSIDYGKIRLPDRQSLGGGATVVTQQGNVFEPVDELRADDRLARVARAVVRLDLLVKDGAESWLSVCTASFVSEDLVLTNYHCIPGLKGHVSRASVVIDYLKADETGARRVDVETTAIESDRDLDYAIVRIKSSSEPVRDIEPIHIEALAIKSKDRLRLIHHPAGRPKAITQFKCSAARDAAPPAPELLHTCDTLPGSSGAVVLSADGTVGIGIHHSGGLDANDSNSFNVATNGAALIARSAILQALVAGRQTDGAPTSRIEPTGDAVAVPIEHEPPSTQSNNPSEQRPAPEAINDLLRAR